MEIITAHEAIEQIHSGDYVGIGGFSAFGVPEELLLALESNYKEQKKPSDLTIIAGICPGDLKEDGGGLSHLKEEGLIKSVIAAHTGMPPAIGRAIAEDKIAGFLLPMGIYDNLLRAAAAGRPGVVSSVGLNTYADPRQEGCMINEKARSQDVCPVSLITLDGKEYLYYRTFPIHVCLIRGTMADADGNISLREEAVISEALEMATAVHNLGGTVIVQVKKIVKNGSIPPKEVHICGNCVDYIVVADEKNHPQGLDQPECFRPEISGQLQISTEAIRPLAYNVKKIIARRAALELRNAAVINLGIGIPSCVSGVANEEGIDALLAIESGVFGGVPLGGVGLGASVNPQAVYHIADNFDFYDGGGLDMAFLGAAEIDQSGNVNVSKFGSHCTGPGGFIDITQNTPEVFFLCTFLAGDHKKFKKKIEQITFSAEYAKKTNQKAYYITERAVFCLTSGGLELREIAPGIDLQKDILDNMEFRPLIARDLKLMDPAIFQKEKMNCIK